MIEQNSSFCLNFDVNSFWKIYASSFEELDARLHSKNSGIKRVFRFFGILAIIFIGLTWYHKDWIYYAAFFLLAGGVLISGQLISRFWIERQRLKLAKAIAASVGHYSRLESVCFTYSNRSIKAFENGKEVLHIDWDSLLQWYEVNDVLWVFHNKTHFIIPYSMSEHESYILFKQALDKYAGKVKIG